MGSLNFDGTRISTNNYILRNVGGAITSNINRLEVETAIEDAVITIQGYRGTKPDVTRTQDSFTHLGARLKITNSIEDELIERQLTS